MFTQYAAIEGLPVEITSVFEHVEERQSRTHEEGRAIDISIRGWNEVQIAEVTTLLNTRMVGIAAISSSDGAPRAVVVHEIGALGRHFHLQVRP